jgi:hypothetical protein
VILHSHPDVAPDELGNAAKSGAEPNPVTPSAATSATPDRHRSAEEACREVSAPPPPAERRSVRSGPPITNTIPPRMVMRPVAERAACLRACYEDGLSRTPSLHGRVAVHFVIDLDGWVRIARLDSEDTGDPVFVACIVKQFVGLHYAEPDGGRVSVVYPVVFSPE